MNSAKKLLDFHFSADHFSKLALNIAGPEIQRDLQQSINKLHTSNIFPDFNHIPEDAAYYYDQFMIFAYQQRFEECRVFFGTSKKARKLAEILAYRNLKQQPAIVQTDFLGLAVEIIQANWKKRMFIPLIYTLLAYWKSEHITSLREFIKSQQKYLDDNQIRFKQIKENIRYFIHPKGSFMLGVEIAESQMNINVVLAQMGFDDSLLSTDFFSEVGVAYSKIVLKQSNYLDFIDPILQFIQKHNRTDTSKQIITELIFKANAKSDVEFRERVKTAAFSLIGDPENDAYWTPWVQSNEKDRENLKQAQKIINSWIIQQFINLFFEQLAMDFERKEFWLKYLKHIQSFKIFSQDNIKAQFALDKRLAPFVSKKVGSLDGDKEQNALVLFINDYALIEFSHAGSAFYAYPYHQSDSPDFDTPRLHINKLKPHSIRSRNQTLIKSGPDQYDVNRGRYIQSYEMHASGKLVHNGNWQIRLSTWLDEYIKI